MNILHAILLGIIEGVTEFLPISSTGHLTIVENLLGYQIDDPAITAFTVIIQIGAIAAAVIYFRQDIIRVVTAWVLGLFKADKRRTNDYKFGWAIIIGSIPIAIVGLLFKNEIETVLRNLWFVVAGLIVWSVVLFVADRRAKGARSERDVNWRDTLIIGLTQCFALVPGVSRSGATISAGLLRGLDRVSATRLSFFLGIPALAAAGAMQAVSQVDSIGEGVGWTATIVGIIVSFVVGYISIAWLLRFVSRHNFTAFIWYRVGLGVVIAILITIGVVGAV